MNITVQSEKSALPSKTDNIVIFVSEETVGKLPLENLAASTRKWIQKRLDAHHFQGKKQRIVTIDLEQPYQSITFVGIGKESEFTHNDLRNLTGDVIRHFRSEKLSSVTVVVSPVIGTDFVTLGETISVGALLGNYQFLKYKSKEKTKELSTVTDVSVYISESHGKKADITRFTHGVERGSVIARGTAQARDFVNEPASHFTPALLAREAQKIAKASRGKVSITVLGESECQKLGMGAYLGVGQGSSNKPHFIVLTYNPDTGKKVKESAKSKNKKKICFVGKSVTFDTGGYTLKPNQFMTDMKLDMSGGAAVLGLFSVLAEWDEDKFGKIPYTVLGVLPACENMISGDAFRPGDVVTAMNGKTIEVMNTDAEGRLTLADALCYADTQLHADIMIDLATLTGSAMVGLGTQIAALLCNDPELSERVLASAQNQGENLWMLPLHEGYHKDLKGDTADLQNVGAKRYGDAIFAGLFLREFVGNRRWAHLDIAGPAYEKDSAQGINEMGGTGYGVRTMLEIITSENI
ncbi:MAG: leucyl aminopeptidase [Patescibacteria group bacterium]